MENRIVVLGGSFNPPPTIAHLKLMKAAVKAVDARLGIFVPTSFQYVARKTKRRKMPQAILSDEIRLKMLESFGLPGFSAPETGKGRVVRHIFSLQ